MRFGFILGVWLLAILTILLLEHHPANAGLPLVKADYQQCLTVNPGPLKPPATRITGDKRQKEIA